MSLSRRALLGAALAAGFSSPASAHSLEMVTDELLKAEPYFQPGDREAPGFTLQDADGRTVRILDFRGKAVVLNFIYINCPDECPLQSEKIAAIQEMVNVTPMKSRVQFISVTTDPKRDRGQVLRDYGDGHGLDPANWIFLTTAPDQPEDATRDLGKSYGAEFKIGAGGEQMHGVVTTVIDQDGRIAARFHSLRFQNLSFVKFLNALINRNVPDGHSPPGFWEKLKEMF
jgi:protein SCO1/2